MIAALLQVEDGLGVPDAGNGMLHCYEEMENLFYCW